MQKLKLAVWCEADVTLAEFQGELAREWAAGRIAQPGVAGLVLHRRDGDLDPSPAGVPPGGGAPDAAVSLWLDAAALAALRESIGSAGCPWHPPGAGRVDAWRVREVRGKTYDRSWPDGSASPGVTQYTLVRPAPGRGREECSLHWRERHLPLALRIHVGLWSYVQDHVVETLTESGSDVMGHAALHFRTLADLRERLFDSDAGADEIYADIPRFMSLEESQTALMTELVLRTPGEPPA